MGEVWLRDHQGRRHMKLATRARYALRMMVEFARQADGDKKVSLSQVAQSSDLPRRYLEQLTTGLKNASLISGTSGKGGGYVLCRAPEEVKVGEVVEAAIGAINIVECVLKPEWCVKSDDCPCRCVYWRINERITEAMNEFSLADLAAGDVPGQALAPVSLDGTPSNG